MESNKEKILFITAYVPHKAAAGEKNTMLMLNELAEKYDVDLVYFKYDYDAPYVPEKNNVRVLKVFKNAKWVKIWGILNWPLLHPVYSIRFSWNKLLTLKKLIKQEHYSAILLNHSNVFIYGKFLDTSTPKLLFAHDVIIQRALRTSGMLMQTICRLSEKFSFKLPNSYIFSFSQKDVDLISRVYNLPAKVCLDYIDPNIVTKSINDVKDYYVFFGDWTRKENYEGVVWFFEKVTPKIRQDIYFKIIGRKFPEEKIQKQNSNIHIDVMGFVDDPYQIISEAKALVTPLFHGAGIKVKVIEALACGTPVIGTNIAFEGLPTGFDNFMMHADSPDEYIEKMHLASTDIEVRRKLKVDFINAYKQDSINHFIDRL